jgi:hypothetical protein
MNARLMPGMRRQGRGVAAQALRHATGPTGFAIIAGEAGTGKSRTLGAIREAYEADGYRVIGMSWRWPKGG